MRPSSFALLAACLACACRAEADVAPAFVRESRRAQRATVPIGAKARVSSPEVADTGVSQTWVISRAGDWKHVRDHAQRQLAPRYRCSTKGESMLSCVRYVPGDYLELTMTSEASADGTSVLVRLEAHPD